MRMRMKGRGEVSGENFNGTFRARAKLRRCLTNTGIEFVPWWNRHSRDEENERRRGKIISLEDRRISCENFEYFRTTARPSRARRNFSAPFVVRPATFIYVFFQLAVPALSLFLLPSSTPCLHFRAVRFIREYRWAVGRRVKSSGHCRWICTETCAGDESTRCLLAEFYLMWAIGRMRSWNESACDLYLWIKYLIRISQDLHGKTPVICASINFLALFSH